MIDHFKGTVICASKYFNPDELRIIYDQGYHHFGENKVKILKDKQAALKDLEIKWHFIGHLQSNKVKDIINDIDYLHTLDRMSLLKEIQKHAAHQVKCLIQLNLTEEPQKSGLYLNNLEQFLLEIKKYDKIEVVGFMTMGKHDDLEKTEHVFKKLHDLSQTYKYPMLSMGMSEDYELAIKHHATHLRIGRKFYELL